MILTFPVYGIMLLEKSDIPTECLPSSQPFQIKQISEYFNHEKSINHYRHYSAVSKTFAAKYIRPDKNASGRAPFR